MAMALQTQYPEYARRKRTAFKSLVSKGPVTFFDCVSCSCLSAGSPLVYSSLEGETSMEDRLQQLEDAHTKKRSRRNLEGDDEEDFSAIDLDDLSTIDFEEGEEDVAPPLEVGM